MLSCLLLSIIAGITGDIYSQANSGLPAFYPTAEHSYGIKEGLPDMAVEKVFLDKAGHLNLHYYTGRVSSKWLYEYYGGRAYAADLELKDKTNGVFINLIYSSGQIYGFQHNNDGHPLYL